ncbi:hypothetical protein L0F63_005483 [Massospora cicadina]|nr:hypothetical protein L0F63_005483 [Massospora cicadina]
MGVPKLLAWLKNRYPVAFGPFKPNELPPIDNLYIDLNGLLHVAFRRYGKRRYGNSLKKVSASLLKDLDKAIQDFRPRHLIYIALAQQRARRFATARKRLRLAIVQQRSAVVPKEGHELGLGELDGAELDGLEQKFEGLGEDEEHGDAEVIDFDIAPSELPQDEEFSRTWLTPGTAFMRELSAQIQEFICKKMSSSKPRDESWRRPQILYSGHDVPGEGEHKIIALMRDLKEHPSGGGITHCILGSDADLVVLGLALGAPNVYVAQCSEAFNLYEVAFVSALAECIGRDLGPTWDRRRIVSDFVMLLTLCGNDFLPHLQEVAIEGGGLDKVMQTYAYHLETEGSYLTQDAWVDLGPLQRMLQFYPVLVPTPEVDRNMTGQLNGLLAVGNYFQRALLQDAHATRKVEVEPYYCLEEKHWKLLTSQQLASGLAVKLTSNKPATAFKPIAYPAKRRKLDAGAGTLAAAAYFRGLQWVLQYYLLGIPSWDCVLSAPLTLLALLPPTCANLLPPTLRPLMVGDDSPLRSFYSLKSTAKLQVSHFRQILSDPTLPYAEFLLKDNSWGFATRVVKGPEPKFVGPAVLDKGVYGCPRGFSPLPNRFRSLSCVPLLALTSFSAGKSHPATQFLYLANPYKHVNLKHLANIVLKRRGILGSETKFYTLTGLVGWPVVKAGKPVRLTTCQTQYLVKAGSVVVLPLSPQERERWPMAAGLEARRPYEAFRVKVGPIGVLIHYLTRGAPKCNGCQLPLEHVAPLQTLISSPSIMAYQPSLPALGNGGCWVCSAAKVVPPPKLKKPRHRHALNPQ